MHFFVLHTFRLDKTGGKYRTELISIPRENKIVEDNNWVTIWISLLYHNQKKVVDKLDACSNRSQNKQEKVDPAILVIFESTKIIRYFCCKTRLKHGFVIDERCKWYLSGNCYLILTRNTKSLDRDQWGPGSEIVIL